MLPDPDVHDFSKASADTVNPLILGAAGLVLVGLHIFFLPFSFRFTAEFFTRDKPIVLLVVLLVCAGAVYLSTAWLLRASFFSRPMLAWVLIAGLAMRLLMFFSHPMLEEDYYRYLWDGAVLAHGHNPYSWSPEQVLSGAPSVPDELIQLAEQSGNVIHRINHPRLKTIYPPVAQLAFASAYFIRPWSVPAWRAIILFADIFALFLLWLIIKSLRLHPVSLLIYWWNPLVVKGLYNSCHMDILLFPCLAGAVLLAVHRRRILASGLVSLAIGVKVWPILLLPVFLRPLLDKPRKLTGAAVLCALILTLLFYPVYCGGLGRSSGFIAYGGRWEMNDLAFMLIVWLGNLLTWAEGWNATPGRVFARIAVVLFLAGWVLFHSRRPASDTRDLIGRSLLVGAALFLLLPAQFPWYFLWTLPLLALEPRWGFLAFTVFLPLYHLRFHFKSRDMTAVFDYGIVWLEYVPVWALIFAEWVYRRRSRLQEAPPE